MKSFLYTVFLLILSVAGFSQQFSSVTRPNTPPKLVVGIVVDQMRYDYLMRYWSKFSENGFRRLVKGGLNCENAHYNYVPTYTGPGHASVYAGTTPAYHGIVANDWYSREEKKMVYCSEDLSVSAVGGNVLSGMMSPKRLMSSNISDELRLAYQKKSKVIGIAIKDRGAILPAGHMPDAAYWFDGKSSGNWMTSTYYMTDLPQWVKDFNAKGKAQEYLSKPWETLLPIESYTESTPDETAYEGLFKNETKPVFPHNLPEIAKLSGVGLLAATPFGNSLTCEFAMEAITGEKLGQDEYPDLLAVSFSSTDYVGHQFGTNAIETEDTYLRLDRNLADFMAFLDKNVGQKDYLIFLTADHGGAYNTTYMNDNRIPAGNYRLDSLKAGLGRFLKPFYGDSIITTITNDQVYFNKERMKKFYVNAKELEEKSIEFLMSQAGVTGVLNGYDIANQDYTEILNKKIKNGFLPARSGDLVVKYAPGWLEYGKTGTTHGSYYNYDTHVPMLWYGWKIPAGTISEYRRITDIAPTLSFILNIPLPNASTGEPIQAILQH